MLTYENTQTCRTGTPSREEFVFEPILHPGNFALLGMEMLWRPPVGLDVALPAARACSLTAALTVHLATLALAAPRPAPVHLNVEPSDFSPTLVESILRLAPSPGSIVLEITETGPLHPEHTAARALLAQGGLLLALDDLGVGDSDVARMCRLAPEIVKFDRSFLLTGSFPADLFRLARQEGRMIILEGVQDVVRLAHASAIGPDGIQGFFVDHLHRAAPDDVSTTGTYRSCGHPLHRDVP